MEKITKKPIAKNKVSKRKKSPTLLRAQGFQLRALKNKDDTVIIKLSKPESPPRKRKLRFPPNYLPR